MLLVLLDDTVCRVKRERELVRGWEEGKRERKNNMVDKSALYSRTH